MCVTFVGRHVLIFAFATYSLSCLHLQTSQEKISIMYLCCLGLLLFHSPMQRLLNSANSIIAYHNNSPDNEPICPSKLIGINYMFYLGLFTTKYHLKQIYLHPEYKCLWARARSLLTHAFNRIISMIGSSLSDEHNTMLQRQVVQPNWICLWESSVFKDLKSKHRYNILNKNSDKAKEQLWLRRPTGEAL